MKDLRERCSDTYQKLHGRMCTEILVKDDIDQLEAFAREIRNEALEEAANKCLDHAKGYDKLRSMARDAADTNSAFAHLCEADAARTCVMEIRALKDTAILAASKDGK